MCLKALPYVKGDPGVSFKWSRDGGSCNELRLEKVMAEHCTGYYSCEIIKNGEHLFSLHHCLRSISKSQHLHLPIHHAYHASIKLTILFTLHRSTQDFGGADRDVPHK